MPLIEVPDSATCQWCLAQPVTLIRRGRLYCGSNCASHDQAVLDISELQKLAETGSAASLRGLELLHLIKVSLSKMRPTRRESCPYCWGPLLSGTDRCLLCNRTNMEALALIESTPLNWEPPETGE